MTTAKRYRVNWPADGGQRFAVDASDYDALAARLAEAEQQLSKVRAFLRPPWGDPEGLLAAAWATVAADSARAGYWLGTGGTRLTAEEFDAKFHGNAMEAVMVGGWKWVPPDSASGGADKICGTCGARGGRHWADCTTVTADAMETFDRTKEKYGEAFKKLAKE